MRSRTADWFETKIRYEKTMDDGMQKPITEQYVVDALSFTEAENSIIEEMSTYISGEFKITGIKPAPYHEIFFSENANDDKWYKTKLQYQLSRPSLFTSGCSEEYRRGDGGNDDRLYHR